MRSVGNWPDCAFRRDDELEPGAWGDARLSMDPERGQGLMTSRVETPSTLRSTALARVAICPWTLIVSATIVAWSIALFSIAQTYYDEYRYQKFDLGNMIQAVWSTTQGRPLETTFDSGEQASRLAGHVDPILALLAPAWMLVPSPLTLVAVQIGACALGAFPVLWLGRRHLRSEAAAGLLALTYLAYPWLAWTAVDAIHPMTLAIPFLLMAIWFLDGDRLVPFVVCAVFVAAGQELMALTFVGLGLWYALARGHRRAGIAIAIAGFLWTAICLKIIVPAFRGSDSQFYAFFESVGGSPEGVLRTIGTDPLSIVHTLTTSSDLLYLLALAMPVLGAFVLAPGILAIAAPQLGANLLSSFFASTDPKAHYIAVAIPAIFASIAFGIPRLPAQSRVPALTTILAVSCTLSILIGPWPWSDSSRPGLNPWVIEQPDTRHFETVSLAVSMIPDDAAVSSTNKAGSRLSARTFIYSVPVVARADWILVDLLDPWVPLKAGPTRKMWGRLDSRLLEAFTTRIARSHDWVRVFARDGVFVFRRAGSG